MVKILPSILSLDYKDTKKHLDLIKENCEIVHFDVMDGHFVPNLSFGPAILKAFKEYTNLVMDVHIMVDNPYLIADILIDAGADIITFHYEVFRNDDEIIEFSKYLRSKNVKVGLSIKPKTNVLDIEKLVKNFDLILVMSVEPGHGGQGFIEDSLSKIKYLSDLKTRNKLDFIIEVDGGINDLTASKVIESGAQWLVSGSYLFKGDFKINLEKINKKNI